MQCMSPAALSRRFRRSWRDLIEKHAGLSLEDALAFAESDFREEFHGYSALPPQRALAPRADDGLRSVVTGWRNAWLGDNLLASGNKRTTR